MLAGVVRSLMCYEDLVACLVVCLRYWLQPVSNAFTRVQKAKAHVVELVELRLSCFDLELVRIPCRVFE